MALQDIIEQVTSLSLSSVNLSLIIILLAVGYICKHMFKTIPNDIIPVILGVVGIGFAIAFHLPFSSGADVYKVLVEGIATAMIASLIYDKGKNIVTDLSGLLTKTTTDTQENSVEEKTEEDQ